MALKFKIKALTEVEEAVRGMYRQDGDSYVLDVVGVVDKDAHDQFRNNNIQLQQQLEKFKNVDPTKYQELLDLQRQLNEGELLKAGKIEEVVNGRVAVMRTTLEGERDTFKARADKAETQLSILLIDSAVRTEALKQGAHPTALDDMVLRARSTYQMVDGVPTPKNEKGEVVYGKDGKTPMPITEWVPGLKKVAPHLFQGSAGGGAGGGARPGATPTGNLTPAQKISMGLEAGLGSRLMSDLPQGS